MDAGATGPAAGGPAASGLARTERLVAGAFRAATGLAFAALILSVSVQVVGRSILNDSPVWTEEATRFALLWLAALGTGLSYRSGDLVDVDIVREALPGRWPRALRALGALATAGLCIALVPAAWLYTSIGVRQTSPALGLRMDWVHASVLVLLVSLALFALLRLALLLAGGDVPTAHPLEEAPSDDVPAPPEGAASGRAPPRDADPPSAPTERAR